MELTEDIKAEMLQHYKKEYPNECCGLLIVNNDIINYKPCTNISENKLETFIIDPLDIIKLDVSYDIIGVVHSHTNGKNYLSKYDLINQRANKLDWYLIVDDKIIKYRPIHSLIGREFKFNQQDCFNIAIDCYMLSGIDFPQQKYVENWYKLGQNLFVENLEKLEFTQISIEDIQLGDVLLFQVGSDIPNHCGVYIGNQMFIHHSINQLSKRDLLGGYWYKHTHSIWRYKWKSQLNFMAILEDLETNLH